MGFAGSRTQSARTLFAIIHEALVSQFASSLQGAEIARILSLEMEEKQTAEGLGWTRVRVG